MSQRIPRTAPRQTQPKFTEYVNDAIYARCSRCERDVFDASTAKKNFGERLRDEFLWRIIAGALVCLDCVLADIRAWVAQNKPQIEDETGRMIALDIYPDSKTILAEYPDGTEPPESVTLVNSQRRIKIDARWLDHFLGRLR